MKLVLAIFIFVLASAGKAQLPKDTVYFHWGNGLRDTWICLYDDGSVNEQFTCDICSGFGSRGIYKIKGDTLFLEISEQYEYAPHWADPMDTVVEYGSWIDTMFFARVEERLFLYCDKKIFDNRIKTWRHMGKREEFLQETYRFVPRKEQ